MKYSYICIEGVIGAGKTSLATRLAHDLNARLILEQFEDNPFLPKFYKEPDKYAFPLELSFLASRFQQLKDQLSAGDLFRPLTIADYFIQKSLIFARKTLKGDELGLYSRLFTIMADILPGPELLVYLHLDVDRLKQNILARGRDYEADISLDYLSRIQEGYFDYIRQRQDSRTVCGSAAARRS
ncbi:MAG TPA: deoxynucleoside kinase, partial [Bacteroidales bacterium]|nr:deoxynucleoside kinase [Bacteroidales bacterium]